MNISVSKEAITFQFVPNRVNSETNPYIVHIFPAFINVVDGSHLDS